MAKRWFTSDTHFGHTNIIRYARGQFPHVDVMDTALINNWNSLVGDEDEVFHLGDFCWPKKPDPYLFRLKGKLHLIVGNHDHRHVRTHPRWLSVTPFLELSVGHGLTLCHYALEVWNKSHWGSFHLHGHSHGSLPARGRRMDVGVDPLSFFPVEEAAVVEKLKAIAVQTPDHHKERR